MALSRRSQYINEPLARCRQGDIIRDLQIIEWAEVIGDSLEVSERRLPYAIILSQECDLEHDFNNRQDAEKSKTSTDKYLPSILVCPAYLATEVKAGTHLENLGLKMNRFGSDQWKRIKQHNEYRYHFLPEDPDNQLPELVVDFKHFFTVRREVLYRDEVRQGYVCSLDDLFREHLSSRFAHYLSRVGLPEIESA